MKVETGAIDVAQSSLQNSKRGEESECCVQSLYLWAFLLEYLLERKPVIRAERNIEVQRNSCVLVAIIARQKTASGSLATSPHPPRELTSLHPSRVSSGPQKKLQQWVWGYRAGRLQPHGLGRQMHTEASPSDRGEDTEVRQLKPGSWYYWEKSSHRYNFGFSQTTPLPSIKADPGRDGWDTSGSTTWHLTTGATSWLWGLWTPFPTTLFYGGEAQVQGDTHLPRQYTQEA